MEKDILSLSVVQNDVHDTLFITRGKKLHRRAIVVQTVVDDPPKALPPLYILRRHGLSSGLRILEAGRVVVASAADELLIGTCEDWTGTVLPTSLYVWREVTLPDKINSFDVRLKAVQDEVPKKPSNSSMIGPVMDVVVGCSKGAILIYEDLLKRILGKEKHGASDKSTDITSRRLHWHRTGPNVVRWSRDGNYLISGGSETVLVLWQLDTSEKNFLPHLSASIRNLAISPLGASYGVHLEDNSVMVLSTSDLRPTTSISGLSVPYFTTEDKSASQRPPVCASTNPHSPDQLLLTVPANSDSSLGLQPNPTILQSFDLRLNSQISRQALTRNNITTFNIGPGGQRLHEPAVQFIRVSHDGQWLATVDEWVPSERDVEALFLENEEMRNQLQRRTEIYLKFWSWDVESKVWELVTRIDRPHMHTGGAGHMFDLASNDKRVEFATVGDDGFVRLWTPRLRFRNGLAVKNKLGQTLRSWTCRQALQLENRSNADVDQPAAACLGFSNDGSLLAASWKSPSTSPSELLHFIDTSSGNIRPTLALEHASTTLHLGFLDRHFISVSEELQVWDVVEQTMQRQ